MNVSKFDKLTFAARFTMKSALETLNDEKSGAQRIAAAPDQAANLISWYAEGWMRASFELQYANWAAEALELALLEVLEAHGEEARNAFYSNIIPSNISEELDRRAADISARIAREAMSVIWRGTESSSNPIRVLESVAKVEVARKMMEALGGLSSFHITGDGITDIIAGKARREEEREEQRRNTPRTLQYWKQEGEYWAAVVNHLGDRLSQFPLSVSRKADALTALADWIKSERIKRGENLIIHVEAL